jgi:hypothetical protein
MAWPKASSTPVGRSKIFALQLLDQQRHRLVEASSDGSPSEQRAWDGP